MCLMVSSQEPSECLRMQHHRYLRHHHNARRCGPWLPAACAATWTVAQRLFRLPPVMPRFTIEQASRKLDTAFPTTTATVKLLQELGLLTELTRQK